MQALAKLRQTVPGWAAIVVVAAAALISGWSAWRRATAVPIPRERTGADFVVRWTCDQGHAFETNGAPGAKSCPTCGGDAYPTFTCTCTNPKCGHVRIMQLRYNEEVRADTMRWRPDGDWQPYEFPPPCPKCGSPMRPG